MLSKEIQTPIILVSQANDQGKTADSIDLLRDCDFALLCVKPKHEGILSFNYGTKNNPEPYEFADDDFFVTVERSRFGRDKQNFVCGYAGTNFGEKNIDRKYKPKVEEII
jgi:hypothetical protein